MSGRPNKNINAAFTASGAKERISLSRCRELLGEACPDSDADLEQLRDQLYDFAHVVAETFINQPREGGMQRSLNDAGSVFETEMGQSPEPSAFNALATLPEDERYVVEERAAIHEFEGGLDRSAAECLAFSEYWRQKHHRI